MSTGVNFNIQVQSNASSVFSTVQTQLGDTVIKARALTSGFSDCVNKLLTFNQALDGVKNLKSALEGLTEPGAKLNTNLTDLSAITGVTGTKLKEIEMAARQSAITFGTNAAQNTESYKLILSQLSPEIAQNSAALKLMGDNVNILSKTMGGNTVAATEVLTTAMNQYGISTKDPIQASKVMAEMMNIMAAGAKEGSAELPQIKNALEQSGMMAKTANVHFAELNGAIQVLDKSGKKGAEGGVAIRNILAELSQGAMNSPKTIKMLAESGINVDKLADKSLTFSQRLQLLKPIANDTARMTLLFGKENVAAAIALANQTTELDRYTNVIQGTNTAVEQANTIMGGYEEKQARIKAKIDDYKISLFNATQAYLPYINGTINALEETGKLASGINSLTTFLGFLKTAKKQEAVASVASAVGSVAMGGGMGFVSIMTNSATASVRGLSMAIKSIPVIGWIVAAIAAVIAIIGILWEKSRSFREVLFGIWEAAKAVFHNIGLVIMRLWNLVIKPYFEFIWNIAKAVWTGIYNAVKWVIEGIVSYFKFMWDLTVKIWTGIWNTIVSVFTWVWDIIKTLGEAIGNFFGGIWDFIKNLFGKVGSFLNEWIVQPIKNAFSGVWDFIVGIFNKIWDGLKKLFKPIIDLWNKIFSSEGMIDVKTAYQEGKVKGGESFDADQKEKKEEEQKTTPQKKQESLLDMKQFSSNLNASGGGNVAGAKQKGGAGASGGNSKPTVINITIHKLQDQTVIHTTNLANGAKQSANKIIDELVMAIESVKGGTLAIS